MKVTYFTNLRGNEGPGFVYEQIRLALEEAGILYIHKYLPVEDPIEFDIKAANEIKKCDVFIRSVGNAGGLFQLRKAKQLGITTIGTSFSTHTLYRERIFNEIYAKTSLDMRGHYTQRVVKGEKYTDYFLVLSEFTKLTYMQNGIEPERIFVVPLGVDSDKFSVAEQPPDYKLLFVGTNAIRKGLLFLLKAWHELPPDTTAELVTRCGVKYQDMRNTTQILDWQSEQDLVDLYHKCSLTILPSLEDGFGATNLESMACGRPVISTRMGIDDIITDYKEGILIPTGDVTAIKDAILYFNDNHNELMRMGKNARHTAEQYTWKRFRSRVVEIVKGLNSK
jgi:glycosyltransferase involved in cell wall biosynthesis